MKKLFFFFIWLLLVVICQADTITVDDDAPADFNNIQAAIDSVNSGDTVIVQPGTYIENTKFNGKNIKVISSNPNDPCIVAATVVNGGGSGSTVTFNGSENNSCALIGFTITGGGGTSYGGGLKGNGCLATISKCVIKENYVSENGGGIDNCDGIIRECKIVNNCAHFNGGGLFNCDGRIIDCNIIGNTAQDYSGGGLYKCNSEIIGCTITNNSASDEGGGCYRCDGSISDCVIQGNSARYGAGVFCHLFGATNINGCIIEDNIASGDGGGIYSRWADITVKNCLIRGNSARDGGGIRFFFLSSPMIINCVVANNTAKRNGGGISCQQRMFQKSTVQIINSTISKNSADNSGGGVHCDSDRYMKISNSIIWWNSSPKGAQMTVENSNLILTINYSDIQDGYEGIEQKPGCTVKWEENNLNIDPEFIDVNNGDLRLRPGSYCIDAGTNTPPSNLEPNDIEGNPRPVDGDNDGESVADMGAYEALPCANPVIRPDQWKVEFSAYEGKANPQNKIMGIRNSGSGTVSWTITENCGWLSVNPTSGSSMGEVDDVVLSVDISGLTKGTYRCELTISDPCAINNPRIVIVELVIIGPVIALSDSEIKFVYYEGDGGGPDIKVLGITNSGGATLHWNITYDCNWLEADPHNGSSFEETDNVDLFVNALGLGRGSYDCQLVVSDPNAENNPETVLVKLIVAAKLYVPFDYGTIQDAIDASLDDDSIVVAEGTYTGIGNRDIDFKGKKAIVQSTNPECPAAVASTIIDCNGTEAEYHRAFYFHSGEDENSILKGLTIKNGYAYHGGGIYCSRSSPTITNCNFVGCTAEEWGGGIYCSISSPLISNCTLTGNSAREGGAITTYREYWDYLCSPRIENCRIFDNTASDSGGGINSDCLSTPIISNCLIYNNFAGTYGGGGISIFQSNPTITGCTIVDNSTESAGCGILQWYEFENGSTLKNCIIWGNTLITEFPPEPPPTPIASFYDLLGPQITVGSEMTISYCDIEDMWIHTLPGADLHLGEGILDADPLFVDPLNGDYHLSEYSMCINSGDPFYIPASGETDIDGQPRIMLFQVDIGADEFVFNDAPVACIVGGNRTIFTERITLDGSCSGDSDSSPGTNDDIACFEWFRIEPCDSGLEEFIGCGEIIDCNLPSGENTIILKVTDKAGDSDTDEVTIIAAIPKVEVVVPQPNAALQDGITLMAEISYMNDINAVYFYVREPNDGKGIPIGYEDLPCILNSISGRWECDFDTIQLDDGNYVVLAKAIDTYGNEVWSEVVPFSIRNWAVIELLPVSKNYRAGRTVPVKFALRIDEAVDTNTPFVYNEELEVRIFDAANPGNILQTSLYGEASEDYRIDSADELYITNFKTAKLPAVYEVEIWRISNDFLIGAFTFDTEILGKGDLNSDGKTNFDDLVIMTENWLGNDTIADIAPEPNGDGTIDFRDFAVFAEEWLKVTSQ